MILSLSESVSRTVEMSRIDLRYERHRLKSTAAEERLLRSIISRGIEEPLQGVDTEDQHILLNGFKRYRCAQKLSMTQVPYQSLGSDEVLGIISLLRLSNARSLNILEQARLIDELKTVFKKSQAEIAELLEKSRAWVSMRCGLISAMSDLVAEKIFAGQFPVYSFMYTLRAFMRLNSVSKTEVDTFVRATAGQGLSTREIETLAHGYFKGPDAFRLQVETGNLKWGLSRMKEATEGTRHCSQFENNVLKSLEIAHKYLSKLLAQINDPRLKNPSFMSQANLLAGGILNTIEPFTTTLTTFYDRSQQTPGDLAALPGRNGQTGNRPQTSCQPDDGQSHHRTRGQGNGDGSKR